MGVRTLVGIADGTTDAAAMYDSVTGVMLGPIFEGGDPAATVEAFLGWLRAHPADARAFAADFAPPRGDGTDARNWDDGALAAIVARWRAEHLDGDGYLKTDA